MPNFVPPDTFEGRIQEVATGRQQIEPLKIKVQPKPPNEC
jgi:hypothetical protein